MWPRLSNSTGAIELPYQDLQNQGSYDVDSVAHSMTNQTQTASNHDAILTN